MTENELRDMIHKGLKRIAPESDPATLLPDKNIREALDVDSYDFLQFLIGLSEQTGVDIPEADYEKVFTIAGLIHYLSARIGQPPPR